MNIEINRTNCGTANKYYGCSYNQPTPKTEEIQVDYSYTTADCRFRRVLKEVKDKFKIVGHDRQFQGSGMSVTTYDIFEVETGTIHRGVNPHNYTAERIDNWTEDLFRVTMNAETLGIFVEHYYPNKQISDWIMQDKIIKIQFTDGSLEEIDATDNIWTKFKNTGVYINAKAQLSGYANEQEKKNLIAIKEGFVNHNHKRNYKKYSSLKYFVPICRVACDCEGIEHIDFECATHNNIYAKLLKYLDIKTGKLKKEYWGNEEVAFYVFDQLSTITVDHIDGNPLNNKLSNLMILCPHCHGKKTRRAGDHASEGSSKRYGSEYYVIHDMDIEDFRSYIYDYLKKYELEYLLED